MAIYHCHISSYRRSSGATATGGLAYRRGLRATCSRTGKKYDFRKKSEVAFSEFIHAQNDRTDYTKLANLRRHYEAVEQSERHCLATLGREIEVALPIELALPEQVELVREFIADIRQSLGLSSTYCDFSIHAKKGNPHAHICFGEREQLAPFVFARKKRRDWDGVEFVRKCRTAWEEKSNLALGKAGFNQRVNASSHADRGLSTVPSLHHGRGHYIQESEIRKMNDAIKNHNDQRTKEQEQEQKQVYQHQADDEDEAPQIECYDLPSRKPFIILLLEQQYGIVPTFSEQVSFVDMKRAPELASIFFKDKARLTDFGNRMEVYNCAPEASAERLVMLAKAKGWGNVVFSGDEAFLRCAFAKAIAEGLCVSPKNPEQQRLLIEIGSGIKEGYVPPPNAQSVERVIADELNDHQTPLEEIIPPTGIPKLADLKAALTARNKTANPAPETKKKTRWKH